jgi:hypothetical protein
MRLSIMSLQRYRENGGKTPPIFSLGTVYRFHLLMSVRAMVQTVTRRSLIAKASVRVRVRPYWVCGGQSDT